MEEKTIIKGEKGNVTRNRNVIFVMGIVICTLFVAIQMMNGRSIDVLGVTLSLVVFVLPFLILGQIYFAIVSKTELTVTNKRVYGTAAFGKRVDLPLDMINAVATSAFNGIAVTTASGAIKFLMMVNKDELHKEISKLLVDRQSRPVSTTIKQEIPQSNADELQKYRDLLDSGTITQEEFDAKKKQLLGL